MAPNRLRSRAWRVIDRASPWALLLLAVFVLLAVVGGAIGIFAFGDHFARQQDVISKTQQSNSDKVTKAATDAAAAKQAGDKAVAFIDTFSTLIEGVKAGLSAGQQQLLYADSIAQWNSYRICVAIGATECIAPPGGAPSPPPAASSP